MDIPPLGVTIPVPVVWAAGIAFALVWLSLVVRSFLRSRKNTARAQNFAAICERRGMQQVRTERLPVWPTALTFYESTARFENTFASPDWSLFATDISSPDRDDSVTLVLFFVPDISLPNMAVSRKGEVRIPIGANGQDVQFESIDFDGRFRVQADDPRCARMVIDQGMMQWLLDRGPVNFQINGPMVSAFIKRRDLRLPQPVELELLMGFSDGFAAHVPGLVRSEFPAPAEWKNQGLPSALWSVGSTVSVAGFSFVARGAGERPA